MIYDRPTLLSLRLRAAMGLRKLSRGELFSRLQLIRTIDPVTEEAYKLVERETHEGQLDDAPHGDPWHVSFHGSQFPGDDPLACPRQALYRLMDFPAAEPFNRNARTVMAAGKAVEVELVRAWHRAGILLSAPPDEPVQTGFELEDAWLTASTDAVILRPRTNWPTPVEIKSKYHHDIELMRCGAKGPDPAHIRQTKVQIAFVRLAQEEGEIWTGLDLCDHGYIYYLSRDKPSVTAEFRVDHDPAFFEAGVKRLKEWKQMFLEDVLPEIEPGKRNSKFGHPNGWRWSHLPCQFCSYKRTCRLDFEQSVNALSDSVGIERAKLVRPQYDPEEARKRVIERWAVRREQVVIRSQGPDRDSEPSPTSGSQTGSG